jgi:hypothetical protein
MPPQPQLLIALDAPETQLTLFVDGRPTLQAELLPLPLGDAACARANGWPVAAAVLETAIGPAWRLLPPVRMLITDMALWRDLRRRVVGGNDVTLCLRDLLTAAAWITGRPLLPAVLPVPHAVQPYQCRLRGRSRLQLDWRDAFTQLLVDLSCGVAAATALERLHAALFIGLTAACAAAAPQPATVTITAAPLLADWAQALSRALAHDGATVQVSVADRG